MKKLFHSTAYAGLPLLATLFASNVQAADGTITFKGEITDTTCQISGGDNTDGGTGSFTVTLPTISAGALPKGERAGHTHFSVLISGDSGCTAGKIASMWFESIAGSLVNPVTGDLKNAGGATNVEVGLLNNLGTHINIWTNENQSTATISASNDAKLDYTAYYQASAANAATAGAVDTNVVYSMTYN